MNGGNDGEILSPSFLKEQTGAFDEKQDAVSERQSAQDFLPPITDNR